MIILKQCEFIKSSSHFKECPESEFPEIAFIGRSNVGKSSLINTLTSMKNLAKISTKPGKTQLINHFLIDNTWYLVDLPGYGWAKVSKSLKNNWQKMINDYLLKRKNLFLVFLLIDIRHEPLQIDLEFITWLGKAGIPFSIIFTKSDKVSTNEKAKNVKIYEKELLKTWEELPKIFTSSSFNKQGKEDIIKYIQSILPR